MHTLETRERFIQLRVEGKSVRAIAEELNISKTTICNWNVEFSEEIAESRQIEVDSILQEINAARIHRMRALGKVFKRFESTLEQRTTIVGDRAAYGFMLRLHKSLDQLPPLQGIITRAESRSTVQGTLSDQPTRRHRRVPVHNRLNQNESGNLELETGTSLVQK